MKNEDKQVINVLIQEAQDAIENLPCGGIGSDGHTQAELDVFAKAGACAEKKEV